MVTVTRREVMCRSFQARSQPSDNEGGRSFSSDFGPFQGLKIGVPSRCLEENLDFLMIDDVTLWSKLEFTS